MRKGAPRRAWTGLIGLALFSAATVGWLVSRDIADGVMGTLLAIGAGGMFYLAVTDLLPRSAKTQYQQSAALAATSLALSTELLMSAMGRKRTVNAEAL